MPLELFGATLVPLSSIRSLRFLVIHVKRITMINFHLDTS